jgi:outer membrane protein
LSIPRLARLAALVLPLAFAAAVPAQTPAPAAAPAAGGGAPVRFAVVNLDRILREAPAAQAAQKRIETEFAKRDQELKDLAGRIQRMQEALQKDAVTLSEGDRRNRERELGEASRDFQRKQTELREDFERRRKEEFSSILQKADAAVRKIAEADKLDIVFQQAVYANPRIDITERVIKMMGQ